MQFLDSTMDPLDGDKQLSEASQCGLHHPSAVFRG